MAGRRMNWNRAKVRQALQPQPSRLDREADKILDRAPLDQRRRHPQIETENAPESKCYRFVGSVLQKDGRWFALDGNGNVAGEYDARWKAWLHADKFGMVEC